MKVLRLALLLLALFTLCPDTGQDKQAARIELNRINVPFTSNAFILSIVEGDKAKTELFLAAGMSPNATYTYGADVNANNTYGASALRMAAVSRHREAVKMLIEHGADLSEFSDRAFRMMSHEPDRNDRVMQLISELYAKRSGYSVTGPSTEAASTLWEIDRAKAIGALKSVYQTEKDKSVKESFRFVIERIEQGY